MDEFEIDHKHNLVSKVTYNKLLLSGLYSVEQYVLVLPDFYLAKYYILKDIISMIEFDMIYSSLPTNLVFITID